jgi:hypothetical protein
MDQSGSGVPPLNLERNRAGTALPLFFVFFALQSVKFIHFREDLAVECGARE